MKLPRCVACQRPVLEIDGQFTKLDSLYIQPGPDAPPRGSAGWWHLSCFAESPAGPAWYQTRLRNYRDVRRFETVVELASWTVLLGPNRSDVIALGHHGELLGLSLGGHPQARAVPGGRIFPRVDEPFHFDIDDPALIKAIKDGFIAHGSYPLPDVFAALGIADRVVHPEAIEHGRFRFARDLQEFWTPSSVSASVEYGVFIPDELVPYVGEYVR